MELLAKRRLKIYFTWFILINLVFAILVSSQAIAQKPSKTDSLQIRNYYHLYKKYNEAAPHKAVRYGLILDSIAASCNYLPKVWFYERLVNTMNRYDTNAQLKVIGRLNNIIHNSIDPKQQAESLKYLGWVYLYMDRYNTSEDYFRRCLEIVENNELQKELVGIYSGLGMLYNNIDEIEKSLHFYHLYLQNTDTTENTEGLYWVYSLMANQYQDNSEYDSATVQYKQALKYAEKTGDTVRISYILNHMGWTYYLAGDFKNSLNSYLKSIELGKVNEDQRILANSYGNIGNIYRDQDQFDLAIDNYEVSIDIGKKEQDIYNLTWVYRELAILFAKQEDYHKAYEYSNLFALYNDTLDMMDYRLSTAREASRIDNVKREKELEILNIKLKQNKTFNYGLLAGLGLIIIIAILLIRQARVRAKSRLDNMKQQITELSQKNLLQQMNPHFLFNTLNSIQYYMFRNDKVASNNYMNKFAKLMRMVLENSQNASISIDEEIKALKLYLELEVIRFKDKFKWAIHIDEEIDTLTFKIPTMLIQPYVENAITHGIRHKEGKGQIDINLIQTNGHIKCTVQDDGIGRKEAEMINIERNGEHNSLGTRITESRLKLVNSLYGKEMKVEYTDLYDANNKPCGTKVEIYIPIIS